jgi:hypothetical protein
MCNVVCLPSVHICLLLAHQTLPCQGLDSSPNICCVTRRVQELQDRTACQTFVTTGDCTGPDTGHENIFFMPFRRSDPSGRGDKGVYSGENGLARTGRRRTFCIDTVC